MIGMLSPYESSYDPVHLWHDWSSCCVDRDKKTHFGMEKLLDEVIGSESKSKSMFWLGSCLWASLARGVVRVCEKNIGVTFNAI